MITKQRIAKWLNHCKDLLRKKLPSAEHENYYRDYDKILCYRSNISQFIRIIFNMFAFATGSVASDKTEELIVDGSPLINTSLCEVVFQYAKWASIVLVFGRVVLILISLKKLSVCKVYFYYNMLELVILVCLPTGESLETDLWKMMAKQLFNIFASYFHFMPSLIT